MPMTKNVDPEALARYLEGQNLFNIIHRASLEAAAAKFDQATQIEPDFARAWGHWAYCLTQIVVAGHADGAVETNAVLAKAETCARKAASLNADDYSTHWDLAFFLLTKGHMEEALEEYEIALDLFDHHTDKLDRRNDLMVEMAEAHVYNGDSARAFELLDRAIRIPDWYRWIRAWADFNAHDYEAAIDEINAMHKTPGDPGYVPDIQLLLAASYAAANQQGLAEVALATLKQYRPDWTLARELARNPFRNAADRDHWEAAMRKAGFT